MLRIVSAKLTKAAQYSFLEEIPDNADDPARGINEENYNEYLVDDVENGPQEYGEYTQPQPGDFLSEIPMGNEMVGVPPESLQKRYDNNPLGLVNDGINNNELISFHYITRDYGNRAGHYAGLRTVEPHYTFVAQTTGNEVLVSYDRSVGDIRAFIVNNIGDGVRHEDVKFADRPEIMVGII